MTKTGKPVGRRPKLPDLTEVVSTDLRALIWWAAIGVMQNHGGAFQKDIENIIESYAETVRQSLPHSYKGFRTCP